MRIGLFHLNSIMDDELIAMKESSRAQLQPLKWVGYCDVGQELMMRNTHRLSTSTMYGYWNLDKERAC